MSENLSKISNLKNKLKTGSGNKLARKRLLKLFDEGTFIEKGLFIESGAITGYGQINGRLVFAISEDSEIQGGAETRLHAEKILECQDDAIKVGAPIIYINDSTGVKLSEGNAVLSALSKILKKASDAKGVVPQISLRLGKCEGVASFVGEIGDFIFSLDDKEADFTLKTEDECISKVRDFISYLPQNYAEGSEVIDNGDDLNRVDVKLDDLVPLDDKKPFDMGIIIKSIADSNVFVEVKENFGKSIKVGFIRLGGASIGVVANNSNDEKATLDRDAVDKAVKFIETCDLFSIPVLTMVDSDGIVDKHAAELAETYALAETSMVTLIVRRAYGSSYIVMGSKNLGADMVYAYPEAKIGVMKAEALSHILYGNDKKVTEINEKVLSPDEATREGIVDDIITPSDTRKLLIAAFDMLDTKSV